MKFPQLSGLDDNHFDPVDLGANTAPRREDYDSSLHFPFFNNNNQERNKKQFFLSAF